MRRDEDLLAPSVDDRLEALLDGLRSTGRWLASGGGRLGLGEYVLAAPTRGRESDWRALARVPRAEQGYNPQGLTVAGSHLWLTDHHRNRHSFLYRLDPDTGEADVHARMPASARHPGGLAYDGTHLLALDYVSARLYRIDPRATVETGQAHLVDVAPTGLKAASALALARIDGRAYLVLSDYLWRLYLLPPVPDGSGLTYLVPLDRVDELGPRSVPDLATLAYDNGGFSQGLAWLDGHLLEAVNNAGTDRIEILDVAAAVRDGDAGAVERLGSVAGPAWMIEDLATDGQRVWTSDEGTYRLYARDAEGLLAAKRP